MLLNMGNTHLWDQDEGFYAATSAEMHARHDWITPTFNGKLFAHKPPMMFWGMIAGYHAFGVSELGARLVSGLFGVGTIVLTFFLARKLFDTTTGLFSGLAIGSCITFTMIARSATADAHLTFFTVLALYLWCRRSFGQEDGQSKQTIASVGWRTWAATYAVMGLAVLTKGPIGFLFPTAVIGLFLLTEQMHSDSPTNTWYARCWLILKPWMPLNFLKTVWTMRPITASLVVMLVASPWYVVVQWRTNGEFLREFIGVHHLGRMSQAMDNHSGPIYYYLGACLIGLYPWSAFAIPTAMTWVRQLRSSNGSRPARLVSCWAAVYLVIFSIASTKLPNYIAPAYPALAIVIGRYFALWTQDVSLVSYRWLSTGWILLVVVGAILVAGFPISGLMEIGGQTMLDRAGLDRTFQQRFVWFGVAGLPLLGFGVAGYCLLQKEQSKLAACVFSLAAISMILILSQFVAPELDRFQEAQKLAQRWKPQLQEADSQIAVLGHFRPTLVFYFGREIDFCNSEEDAVRVVAQGGHSIVVTTELQYAKIKHQLPQSIQVIERVSQFPNRGELLVLGDKSLMR